jgi:hypothetical protein
MSRGARLAGAPALGPTGWPGHGPAHRCNDVGVAVAP